MKKLLLASLIVVSVGVVGCEQKKEVPSGKQETPKEEVKQEAQAPVETPETSKEAMEQKQEPEIKEEAQTKIETEKKQIEETTKQLEQKAEEVKQEVKQEVATATNQPKPTISGEDIFKAKGCTVCHHPEIDTTGPALKKISQFYKGKKEDLIAFLKGKKDPIVDPSKFTIMKPQINITKNLSDEELSALADYILSF